MPAFAGELVDTLQAASVVLACGSQPCNLDIPGSEHCITTDHFFALPEQPQELLIVGAGCVGVETGSIMAALGSKVTMIFREAQPLAGAPPPS